MNGPRAWTAGTVVAADRVLRPGTVWIGADGTIADVVGGAARRARDFGGEALLVPGAVDLHGDAIEKLVLSGELPLPAAVRLVATRPAHAAGLLDRGELAPGKRADIVALRPDGSVLAAMLAGRPTL